MAAVRGDRTLSELASGSGVHPVQVTQWTKRAVAALPAAFATRRSAVEEQLDGLHIIRSKIEPEQFDATRTVRAGRDVSKGASLKPPNFFLPAAHFALDNFFEADRPLLGRPRGMPRRPSLRGADRALPAGRSKSVRRVRTGRLHGAQAVQNQQVIMMYGSLVRVSRPCIVPALRG